VNELISSFSPFVKLNTVEFIETLISGAETGDKLCVHAFMSLLIKFDKTKVAMLQLR
jgi:hypothetical protein